MARHGGGPEEFFEVFREVQEGKKRREETPTPAERPEPRVARPAAPWALGGTLTVSYPAAGGAAVIVVLLVVLAYLMGRQHGWRSHAATRRAAAEKGEPKLTTGTPAAPASDRPELVDGKVFTLLTLGKAQRDRESVQREADYLNTHVPFRALQLEAYVLNDSRGCYRLCARGFRNKDDAARKQARGEIRGLTSRQGRREYLDADFLPP